jgi:hypothetical protein
MRIDAGKGEMEMKYFNPLFPAILGLALAVPTGAAAAPNKDLCIVSPTGGGSFNTFVIQDVPNFGPGESVNVHGVFFTGAQRLAPFHGTVAKSPSGPILMGLFVHSTAQSTNDFTVSGVLDENFAGTLTFDNDGDFRPNGTLAMQVVDCATIVIPWPTALTP